MSVIKIVRCDATAPDFIELVKLLDADLAIKDGEDHAFYDQFNKLDKIKHVIVYYEGDQALACGAIKAFDDRLHSTAIEVKRMFTQEEARGKGIASRILLELELWARDLGYEKCMLETGKQQPDAIALYLKNGYKIIENYGQYAGIENSVCFEKNLIAQGDKAPQ